MTEDRPELHPTPGTGWLNDANGLVQRRGRHHQFDPESLWFGRMNWGHFSSEDLVQWTRHPSALAPSDGPDRDGVWSGCVIDDAGTATAVYTGVVTRGDGSKAQAVCLATSTDPDLVEWVKDPDNPVVVEPPPFEVEAFRDPYVWKDGQDWSMLLGTGLADGSGAVFLYRSEDLRDWRYQGVFVSGADLPPGAPWTGSVWECPNLTILDDGTALLLISVHDPSTLSLHYTVALIGRRAGMRLVVESAQRLDHGHDCYAAAIEKTNDGRVLTYGWAWDALTAEQRAEQGWAGCMTIPRELGVQSGALTIAPARELRAAAMIVETVEATTITPERPLDLRLARVARLDAAFRLDHASTLRIAVRRSALSGEELAFEYSASRGSIVVDRTRASSRPGVRGGFSTAAYALPAGGHVDITIIVDHTIIEIFVGGVVAFSERVYPQAADADGLRIESRSETFGEKAASIRLERLTLSQFAPSEAAHELELKV